MVLDSFCYEDIPIIAAYKGSELVYIKRKALLRSGEAVINIDSSALLRALESLPMITVAYVSEVEMEGSLSTAQSAAMAQDECIEIDAYADLYIYNTAHLISEGDIEVAAVANVQKPMAAVLCTKEDICPQIDIYADGVASDSTPMAADAEMKMDAEAFANTPAATPIECEGDMVIESDGTLVTNKGTPLSGWLSAMVTAEAVLTVAPSASMEAICDICIDSVADLYCKDVAWIHPVLENGVLYIQQAVGYSFDGYTLTIY